MTKGKGHWYKNREGAPRMTREPEDLLMIQTTKLSGDWECGSKSGDFKYGKSALCDGRCGLFYYPCD